MRNILIILLLLTLKTYSQDANQNSGARSSALNNASVCLSDVWSVCNNQAGLANIKNIEVGVYYENRFSIKELSNKTLAVALPIKFGVFGLRLNHFGYSAYNESAIGIAYSKLLSKRFSTGIQLNYNHINIAENYNSKGYLSFDLGILANITNQLAFGMQLINPINSLIKNNQNFKTPTFLKIGLSYFLTEKILLVAETKNTTSNSLSALFGIEYNIIPILFLRGGISTNPASNSFGVGLLLNKFTIDISSSYHYRLGFSPQCSIGYKF